MTMANATSSKRLPEFLGLSSFGLALMLLISLATYSPRDPAPFFKAGASAEDTIDDCRTRDFINQFEIVVAFDEVPVPETATVAPGVPAAPATGVAA